MSESIWNDPRITAYVLGELPSDERTEFEQELTCNADLAAAVAEARSVTLQLGELYVDESTPPLDAKRRRAILAGEPNAVTRPGSEKTSWRLPLAIMATAASLLLLLGLAPWMAERQANVAMRNAQQSSPLVAPALQEELRKESAAEMDGDEMDGDDALAHEVESFQFANGGVAATETNEGAAGLPSSAPLGGKLSMSEREELLLGEGQVPSHIGAAKNPSTEESLSRIAATDESEPFERSRSEMPDGQIAATGQPSDHKIEALPDLGTIVIRGVMKDVQYETGVVKEEVIKQEQNRGISASPDSASDVIADQFAAPSLQKKITDTPGRPMQPIRELSKQADAMVQDELVKPSKDNNGEGMLREVAKPSPVAAPASAVAPANEPRSNASGSEAAEAKYARGSELGRSISETRSDALRFRLQEYESRPALTVPQDQAQFDDYGDAKPEGTGPGKPGDQFEPITDNPFKRVSEHPLSTFSVDVDTASYSKTRDFLMRANQLPRPDAVRIEELINYFDYDYAGPKFDKDHASEQEHPLVARAIVTGCPWNEKHRLARIAIKGREMDAKDRPKCNLVFLIDTSGSMNAPNKLPLVLQGMEMLLDRLNKKDRVAIVVYAGSAGLVLDSTKVGKNGNEIKHALTRLSAGGSTNGGAGISLAYQTARDHFISEGVNRIILCTDGDFNVGTTGTDALVRMVEEEAKGGVFLSVLGFGMGNHNDAMLERVSGRGNGNYAFIDTDSEARKVLVEQTNATLVTIAKDVKLQIEFNPSKVSSYRLIGYENRILAKEDFNDDKKDAGEIGAGHEVTALYEIVPAGVAVDESAPEVDPLKYQAKLKKTDAADSDETLTVKLRYKQPNGSSSTLVEFPVRDDGQSFDDADADVRFAAAVAGFGMQLRRSDYKGNWMLKDVLSVAEDATGKDEFGLRAEFLTMVRKASELMGHQ